MNTKSFHPKSGEMTEKWYLVDAEGQTTGRLASRVAALLRGKTTPRFTPSANPNIHVVVVNADKVVLTGKKWKDKQYVTHSGWRGGFRSLSAKHIEKEKPGQVLRNAIDGMIPHTRLGNAIRKNLRVYAGTEHGHAAQNPEKIELTPLREARVA